MKALAGAALAAVVLAGCTAPPSRPILKLFGGPDSLDIVQSPQRVEAFRLRAPGKGEELGAYNRWPTIGAPVRVAPDVAERFSHGLTRERTYLSWDEPKNCTPRPGYLLRFSADGRSVDVAFCFECTILFTYRGPERIWYANFDEAAKPLAALMLRVFPGDPALRALAEKGSP